MPADESLAPLTVFSDLAAAVDREHGLGRSLGQAGPAGAAVMGRARWVALGSAATFPPGPPEGQLHIARG